MVAHFSRQSGWVYCGIRNLLRRFHTVGHLTSDHHGYVDFLMPSAFSSTCNYHVPNADYVHDHRAGIQGRQGKIGAGRDFPSGRVINSGNTKMKLVTVAQMRDIEKEADANGLSYAEMMQNAGRGLAEVI